MENLTTTNKPFQKSEPTQFKKLQTSLQISRSMAYNLCKQPLFKTVKVGKYVRVSKPSFDEWLDTQNKKENQYGIYRKAR